MLDGIAPKGPHGVGHGPHDVFRSALPVRTQKPSQALLAEALPARVLGLPDPVGAEEQQMAVVPAGMGLTGVFLGVIHPQGHALAA